MLKPMTVAPFLVGALCFAQTRINLRYQSDFDAIIDALLATPVALTASAPVVISQGATYRFTANVPVVWSLGPGSQGTIDEDGTYHAPASVKAKQSVAGCQILPNNHVFNTRIDQLPIHPQSDAWIASNSTGNLYYSGGFAPNAITSAAPTTDMVFAYTPMNNGTFRIPGPPAGRIEGGWYVPPFSGVDRHLVAVERDSCTVQEIYNFYPVGTNTYNPCLTCNSQSGVRYSNLSYDLPANGATDAASMFLVPLVLHPADLLEARRTDGVIQHALRVTIPHPDQEFIWPAVASASYGHVEGRMKMGARARLKASFEISTFSAEAQVLLKQLKQYGVIVSDASGMPSNWEVIGFDSSLTFYPAVASALTEVGNSVRPTDMEVVDESSLMVSPTSGYVNPSTGYMTPDGEVTVIATSIDNPAMTASARVVLAGITIGVERPDEYFQAGAGATQLVAWVNGHVDKSVAWSMSPSVGTLTPGGLYTPPVSVVGPTTTTITAAAGADPAVTAVVKATILPAGILRIDAGNTSGQPYVDTQGNGWLPDIAADGGKTWEYGGDWSSVTDGPLYNTVHVLSGDLHYDIRVPDGNYRITAKFAEASYGSSGIRIMHLESQGMLIHRDVDVFAAAGGARKAIDFELPATVTDGRLSFVLRRVKGEQTFLAGLQIAPDPGTPAITITPTDGGAIFPLATKQFHAVAWFMEDERVNWTISPQIGSVDANGLYTGPSSPVEEDTLVTITATSLADPAQTATAAVTVLAGVPPIRVNSGGSNFTDALGRAWAADYGSGGGSLTYGDAVAIEGATDGTQPLYQSTRYAYNTQAFYYEFPTVNGDYQVTLKWAEHRAESQGNKMDVKINGVTVLTDFDPVAAAGGVRKAYDRTFNISVTNQTLRIDFIGKPGAGYVGSSINGIQIEQAAP